MLLTPRFPQQLATGEPKVIYHQSTMIAPDYLLFTNLDVTRRIFFHLAPRDLNNCALVNKVWHAAVKDARENRILKISPDILKQISSSKSNLDTYLKENLIHAPDVVVYGWTPKSIVPEKIYDRLFKARLKARNLTLKGRGKWLGCKCPRKGSSCGEQIDSIDKDDITNLESITVRQTFQISACALLDLVSRSPKLKIFRFFGVLDRCDHTELFNLKRFLSDLDCLIWPYISKKHVPTLTTLVKRNENITTFYSNGELTCDLLATDVLNNVKYLSLILNEKWIDDNAENGHAKRYVKRAQRFTTKIKYLGLGKKIEALEVRTFNIFRDEEPEEEPSDLKLKLDPLHEQYKRLFWEQVAKLPKLKYLCVHGDWELNEVCRELSKRDIKIEFLRLGLLPASLHLASDNQDDSITLCMVDEARNLKKLPKLRSLWFSCHEKLASIDEKTAHVLKDLMDLIWMMDIKVGFTEEVDSLLNIIMRRGNQLGKTYKVFLHIQCKGIADAAVLAEHNLKFPMGTDLRQKLGQIAEMELNERKRSVEAFQIWGLQQIDNTRDRSTFEQLKSNWLHYNGKFNLTSPWQNSA